MTSIIIYSLYIMPCVHLHRRGHWTFYLVLYETFEFNLSRRRVVLCHWQIVIQLWNELDNILCFQLGEMLFLLRRSWSIFRVSFLALTCSIFFWGGPRLAGNIDVTGGHICSHLNRCAALDRNLLNPSFYSLTTWDSSDTGRENWLWTFYNIS